MTEAKVLIVEDDPDIRELVRLYLLKEKFQVFEAGSGSEALHCQETIQPDLLLLDILLPDMDGFEICTEIRAKSNIPIIFMSCKMDTQDIIAGLQLGADDYVTKPFDPEVLIHRVKAKLRRYQSLNQPDQVVGILDDESSYAAPAQPFIEPLTRREMEILSLIEIGFTNQEIAAHFHISVGTVKGYNNQLFGKLRVRNRTQAILQARQLGLLATADKKMGKHFTKT